MSQSDLGLIRQQQPHKLIPERVRWSTMATTVQATAFVVIRHQKDTGQMHRGLMSDILMVEIVILATTGVTTALSGVLTQRATGATLGVTVIVMADLITVL
ncbi:unnamed protein product [Durusdinium trenchii]|uniref:Uncharacterized protein n=1 Tax=Durusdinium trenchii TaxID=1381693 RepID=A0ABP0P9A3_9DINO